MRAYLLQERGMAVRRQYYVYVVELTDEAGPRLDPRKPCVYVGQTGMSPEERFEQHLAGYKASRWVKNFGVRLRPRLYRNYGPYDTWEASVEAERRLKEKLAQRGYRVRGGH